MAQRVLIDWNLASFTGWGVYGLNLALHWANDARIEAVVSLPVVRDHVAFDPLRLRVLQPFFARSQAFQAELKTSARIDFPVLSACNSKVFDFKFEGRPTIPVIFCEDEIARDALDRTEGPLDGPRTACASDARG